MQKIAFLLAILLLMFMSSIAQTLVQNVRGTVVDKESQYPLAGVNVIIADSDPIVGTITDADGSFVINDVAVGRVTLQFSFVGYRAQTLGNIQVLSARETQLSSIEMEESVSSLDEIVVVATDDKDVLNNEMTLVSARSFDIEETGRFAGNRNDPARMASNFAGVANANDGRNDIVIRGNSPTGLLWRMEGLDIPNPSHYGGLGLTGGPVTILNNNQLAKSDFITSAFAADYGNAISGVFDLRLRNGNAHTRESMFQVGFNGLELGTEGPLSSNRKASYMVNYRYSTLGVVKAVGLDLGTGSAVPEYQDISFNIHIPTAKGVVDIFGLGGLSGIELLGSQTDLDSEDLFGDETQDIYNDNIMGVAGVSYTHYINSTTYWKTIFGASYSRDQTDIDSLIYEGPTTIIGAQRSQNIDYGQEKYSVHSYVNKKINARNTLTTGVMADLYRFDIAHDMYQPQSDALLPIRKYNGTSTLGRAYASLRHRFSEKLDISAGLYGQYWELSGSGSVEPRFGLRYQANPLNTFSLGIGHHSQIQPLPLYFQTVVDAEGNVINTNEDLDLVKAHHLVIGYERILGENTRLKAEVYSQWIHGAGAEAEPSGFSTLNIGADFDFPDKNFLVNDGKGYNYGLEVTLERYFSKGFYYMVNGSVFESKYQGSDDVWRNTAFNGRFIANALAGKEWRVGRGNNTVALDWKVTAAGGRYYTPVDAEASAEAGREILDEQNPYSERMRDYFRMDLKASYRMNRKKVTHEISLDVQNVTNRQNDFIQVYNRRTNDVGFVKQMGLFPIPQYRIYF